MWWILGGKFSVDVPRKNRLRICHRKLHRILHFRKRNLSPRTHSGESSPNELRFAMQIANRQPGHACRFSLRKKKKLKLSWWTFRPRKNIFSPLPKSPPSNSSQTPSRPLPPSWETLPPVICRKKTNCPPLPVAPDSPFPSPKQKR